MPVPQTPGEMEAIMIEQLPERYGKTLEEWMTVCASAGLEKKMEFVQFLKQEHGVKHGEAFVLTQIYFNDGKPVYGDPESLLRQQYKNPEQRKLYEMVLKSIQNSIDHPIKFGVCKGHVSVLGARQFAVILPKRNSIWIGLALGDEPVAPPLKTAKNIGGSDKINCYVEIQEINDYTERAAQLVLQSYRFNS